jgi:O-antigen ligase
MAGLGRAERLIVLAAVFLALFPNWRSEQIFFTISDLLFCLSLLLLLLTRGIALAPMSAATPFWLIAFVIFALALTGSSLAAGDPGAAVPALLQYVFTFVLLPFALNGRDPPMPLRIVKTLVASIFIIELAGVAVYFGYEASYEDYQRIGHDFITGARRLGSFLGDPNSNAGLIAMTLPFVLFLWTSRHISALIALPVLGVLGTALILSSSVSGTVASVLGLGVFLALTGKLRSLLKFAATLGLCAVVIAGAGDRLPEVFQSRVLGALRSGDLEQAGTYSSRMALIEEALDMVDDTVLVGIGLGQFRRISAHGAPVHNTYILVWVEGGMVALMGLIGLLTTAALSSLAVRRHPEYRLVGALGFTVTVVSALLMTAAAHFYARFWAMPLLVALTMVSSAMVAIAARNRESSLSAPSLPEMAPRPPAPAWQRPQAAHLGSAGRHS